MSAENQAKFLKCARCGNSLSRKDGSGEFYSCDEANDDHKPYLVSSKFDTETGTIIEPPIVTRRVGWITALKRKIRHCLL